jgi:hypothetical protein
MMKAFLVTTAIALAFASTVSAQLEGNPANWCREGFFTRESQQFGVGFVKSARGYFYTDDQEKCPASQSCRTRSYVVKGDTVITSKRFGEYTCGWFSSSKGAVTVGWLKTADIEFPAMLHDAGERVWTGEWKYATSTINFTPNKLQGFLNVTGDSYWKGLGDNIHIGELDGKAPHKDGVVQYSDGESEYDCRATMRLATEKYLIVADNGNCGGMNVSFSGIYQKVPAKVIKKK